MTLGQNANAYNEPRSHRQPYPHVTVNACDLQIIGRNTETSTLQCVSGH